MIIYQILNQVNQKRYIGQTAAKKRRWAAHKRELKKGIHKSCHLQGAWKKYGENAFVFEIIEECTSHNHMNERERYWIEHYQTYRRDKGYNLDMGGNSGPQLPEVIEKRISPLRGRKRPPELVKRLADMHRGKKWSPEARQRHSAMWKAKIAAGYRGSPPPHFKGKDHYGWGKKRPKEVIAKMSAASSRPYSERFDPETAERLKQASRERFMGPNNPRYREVDMDAVEKALLSGETVDSISQRLGVYRTVIIDRFKDRHGGVTIRQFKKERGLYKRGSKR